MQSLRSVVIFARWAGLLLVILAMLPAPGLATHTGDVQVTDQTYTRHDGGSDTGISRCGSDFSDTTPDPPGDATPEGGGNRQANEPAVAINPSDTSVMVAGANDYCGVATWGDAWMGFYVSTDGGASWMNSLNPGYPTDSSGEGTASPIFRRAFAAGDPIMDWDNDNNLFYGGISFNRTAPNPSGFVTPTNGDVIVSTWNWVGVSAANPLGMNYIRTTIVGKGTPSAFFFGRFNDKPSLKVDDWSASPHEGNVYVSWTLFPGAGSDQILFSRSTDNGETFSKPIKISMGVANAQGSDIAVAPNGDVYVVWRVFAHPAAKVSNAIVFVKSTDGGQTFSNPKTIAPVAIPSDRRDRYVSGGGARDCGDGPFLCVSSFVFHRNGTLPQAVIDTSGKIYVTWEQVVPGTPDNGDTYRPDGQARVVWTKSTNGGASWSAPAAVDPQSAGHQWWLNIEYDKSNDTLALIFYDSRADTQYSVNRPPGNKAGGTSTCGDPVGTMVCDVLHTFIATSTNGGSTWTSHQVSTMGHQPEYEMFGNRQVPFHGDYLWVDAVGGIIYGVWTDNRDVVPSCLASTSARPARTALTCTSAGPLPHLRTTVPMRAA